MPTARPALVLVEQSEPLGHVAPLFTAPAPATSHGSWGPWRARAGMVALFVLAATATAVAERLLASGPTSARSDVATTSITETTSARMTVATAQRNGGTPAPPHAAEPLIPEMDVNSLPTAKRSAASAR